MVYRASVQRYIKTLGYKKISKKKFFAGKICESVGVFRRSPLLSSNTKHPQGTIMKTLFATVLGSAVKNFEDKEYHRVTAMTGTTVVKFKSVEKPEIGAVALIDSYVKGDIKPWDDTVVEEGREFSVLQMYTNIEAINSAKLQAKALEGLTL